MDTMPHPEHQVGGDVAVLERPVAIPKPSGDHDRMSHIILEGWHPEDADFVEVQATVMESQITGTPIKALCGKIWVPNASPKRYSLCGTCRDIAVQNGWKIPAQ